MNCPSCRRENPAEANFCLHCGARLARVCPQCQRVSSPEARFCMACGHALTATSHPVSPPESGSNQPVRLPDTPDGQATPRAAPLAGRSVHEAERRHLTVLFCDLVESTALAGQLDPEDLREVVRAYQATCAEVIRRFEGHIAQYLGDGLLVYFGYPQAHEDDALRAVRTGLGLLEAMGPLRAHLAQQWGITLAVRLGIHTGPVVVGPMGGGDRQERLALGETPNIASRLQGLAAPDTMVLSAATYRLVQGFVTCHDLGPQTLKGVAAPVRIYCVLGESGAQSRLDVSVTHGLTPLVGREVEIALLLERWAKAKDRQGQVVVLSGEAGIGKSRLVHELQAHAEREGAARITLRCSPYHQQSALYPVIEHLQQLLQFRRDDIPTAKLAKLEHMLRGYGFPLPEVVPLLAALLSLPAPEHYPPLQMSPQRQKQHTQAALMAWLLAEAERQPVLAVWEDLHWADPSTLEWLGLFLDQVPTARLLTLLTCRPEFHPPWPLRSHLTQLTLSRLARRHVEVMVESVAGGKTLPPEVVQQVVIMTDGVPLFVEELTKAVVEAGGVHDQPARRSLAIPATLHDSLMARLDRLGPVKEVAQLGTVLGREFTYELLRAVWPAGETALQQGLATLVEAELLYQRGLPPQARYLFKHALIQDAAYQSLLRSTRQRYHQQIAQVLEAQFAETKETQPELLAHHYTEAGFIPQAIPYWQHAGQKAIERSANVEAVGHLSRGLELLKTLPDTPEHVRQELALQIALGAPLIATRGYAAPEVEHTYARARELCRQVGETPQLFPVLRGLWVFNEVRAEHQAARELGEQLLTLAQSLQDTALFVEAHRALGNTLFWLGEETSARVHLEQSLALYDLQQHSALAFLYGSDPGVICRAYTAFALWCLGYPDQALQSIHAALTLAQRLAHPHTLALALQWAAMLHWLRREGQATKEQAEAAIALATEQGFPFWVAQCTIIWGWALADQGQGEKGIAQLHEGVTAYRATGAELFLTGWLAMLAEAYGKVDQREEGLRVVDEALTLVEKKGEQVYEAEIYRLKGTLALLPKVQGRQFTVKKSPESGVRSREAEAEECFWKAIEVARRQQAKSLELRAVISLARLWQHQGKQEEARKLLAEVYSWFTEGFDTADLKEARALLGR